MTAVVSLSHVEVRFNLGKDRWLHASKSINLDVGAGEIVTVVGESGCGKSTVGKLVLGVLRPTEGTVSYQGQDIWAPGFRWDRARRLLVSVVHQDSYASLNPVRTVGQTLRAPLLYHRLATSRADADQQVQRLLERTGLTPASYYAARFPFQLSGGQRQRVAIARATMLNPQLILADEPVSGVDASMRVAILNLMRTLNQEQNLAFVYITHDLATARYFGHGGRLVVMYLGSMVEVGEVGRVIDTPRHPYLQAMLAALPRPGVGPSSHKLPLRSLDLPDATRPPSGCAFHPRCPYAVAVCEKEIPTLQPAPDDSSIRVACHRVQQGDAPGRDAERQV